MNMKEEERRPRAAKMRAARTPMKTQPEPHEEDKTLTPPKKKTQVHLRPKKPWQEVALPWPQNLKTTPSPTSTPGLTQQHYTTSPMATFTPTPRPWKNPSEKRRCAESRSVAWPTSSVTTSSFGRPPVAMETESLYDRTNERRVSRRSISIRGIWVLTRSPRYYQHASTFKECERPSGASCRSATHAPAGNWTSWPTQSYIPYPYYPA
jgi:hypothetical protein